MVYPLHTGSSLNITMFLMRDIIIEIIELIYYDINNCIKNNYFILHLYLYTVCIYFILHKY